MDFVLVSCQDSTEKIPVYAWESGPGDKTDQELLEVIDDLKNKGVDGLMYNGGQNPATYERVGALAKEAGLEFHAWIPTMVQSREGLLDTSLYAVNGLGQSAWTHPAYVPYYKFLCPAKPKVHEFIQGTVTELSKYEIDGIHLDYVRFPDVILAKGLWSKYNLIQDKEYPQFDYCYCDTCREKFKAQTGIDPMELEDPATHREWLQFRYDLVTTLVNDKLIPIGRNAGKVMSAAVFPNWKNVRQEWPTWKLDAALPMLYNRFYLEDAEWIKQQCKEGIESLQYATKLYSGLMVDEPEKLKEYVIKSFAGEAEGISIFSLRGLKTEHLKMLTSLLKRY